MNNKFDPKKFIKENESLFKDLARQEEYDKIINENEELKKQLKTLKNVNTLFNEINGKIKVNIEVKSSQMTDIQEKLNEILELLKND